MSKPFQPKTGAKCHCKPGIHRDNCPDCEGTGMRIDFAKIRATTKYMSIAAICQTLGESMPRSLRNDIPAIRTAINDTIDSYTKDGYTVDSDWCQQEAVEEVKRLLTERD